MSNTGRGIPTTHVGSLPRSQAVTDVIFARERGDARDLEEGQHVRHRRTRQQSREGIVGENLAVIDDHDAIAQPLNLFHVVRGVDQGSAFAGQHLDEHRWRRQGVVATQKALQGFVPPWTNAITMSTEFWLNR